MRNAGYRFCRRFWGTRKSQIPIGISRARLTCWVLLPEDWRNGGRGSMQDANFASVLQSFFSTRLIKQRDVSPHTIAAYRDTFRLLLQFAVARLGKAPSQMSI